MNIGIRVRSEVAPSPRAPSDPPPPTRTLPLHVDGEDPPPPPPRDGEDPPPPPDSARPMSPGLPPSYAESLGHRTVEYAYDGYNDLFYTGPPPPLPTNYHLGSGGERQPEDGRESRASIDEDTEKCMKMTLPPMHICMAVTCLVFNFLIPGSGTMLAAFGVFCCTKGNEWTVRKKFGACCLNFTIGLAQLILTPLLLLGWVWSILWGFAFVGVSCEAYHGRKLTDREAQRNPHRPLTATPRGNLGQATTTTPRPDPSGPSSIQTTNSAYNQEESQMQVISVITTSAEPLSAEGESTRRGNPEQSARAQESDAQPSRPSEQEVRITDATPTSNGSEQLPNCVTET